MKKEKIIYNGESRLIRLDDKNRKYILYNREKVYLEKGGAGFILPSSIPGQTPRPNQFQTTARRIGTVLKSVINSKTATHFGNAALTGLTAKAETDERLKSEIFKLSKF